MIVSARIEDRLTLRWSLQTALLGIGELKVLAPLAAPRIAIMRLSRISESKVVRVFKLKAASLFVLVALSIFGCASRPVLRSTPESTPSKQNVSELVPTEFNFAKEFVQFLVNSGWTVQPVRPSKLNGFFTKTQDAAWIETDHGIMEVIFFDNDGDVQQIQISEEGSDIPNYHKYVLKLPTETRRIEASPTYFTKHRNMLIVTIDAQLNKSLNQLLASSQSGRA